MAKNTEQSFYQKHRTAILVASLVLFLPPLALLFQVSTGDNDFCGTWCPRMFWTWRQGMTGNQFLMGMLRAFMGVALVLVVLATTLFFGRWWCSHLCPIGGTTELGSRLLPRFLKIDFSAIPAPPVRYGYLAVYLIAPLAGIGSLCCNYCNFATIPRMFGAAFTPADLAYFLRTYGLINLGLIVVLGFMARGGRAYCNFLCPVGALDSLANRLGLSFGKRMQVAEHRCTGCGVCTDVCPTWAITGNGRGEAVAIDQYSCFPCGACEKVCPEGAILYGRKGDCHAPPQ